MLYAALDPALVLGGEGNRNRNEVLVVRFSAQRSGNDPESAFLQDVLQGSALKATGDKEPNRFLDVLSCIGLRVPLGMDVEDVA